MTAAAAVRALDPARFEKVRGYEDSFNHTIRSDMNWSQLADQARPFVIDTEIAQIAMSPTYDAPIYTDNWTMPAGAFGESCGPS